MEGQRGRGTEKWVTSAAVWPPAVQKVTWWHQVRSSLCLLEVPNAIFKPRTDFENIFLLLFCHTCSLAYSVRACSANAQQSLLFLQADLACTAQTLDPRFGTKDFAGDGTSYVLISGQVIPIRWEMELLFFNCYPFMYEMSFLAIFCSILTTFSVSRIFLTMGRKANVKLVFFYQEKRKTVELVDFHNLILLELWKYQCDFIMSKWIIHIKIMGRCPDKPA